MFFQRFTFRLLAYLLLINGMGILLVYLIRNTHLYFSMTGLGILMICVILSMYFFINQIKEDIKKFVIAIKTRDSTLNFKNKATKGSFPELYQSFQDILKANKDVQLEKDSMFQLIKTILEQVPVGVIVVQKSPDENESSEIVFFNQSASTLLQVPTYKYWHRIKNHLPAFTQEIEKIQQGGKRFVELKIQDKLIQLSTEVIPLNLYAKDYFIISFQNIKDEIEQKEAEAWNRLIGVISHEILNSITPISSLSDTVSTMVMNKDYLDAEDLEDLRPALQIIKKRSMGLLDFVKDYRLIAELPTPNLEPQAIGEILKHLKILMQPFAKEKNIALNVEQTSSKITLQLDLKLIEQALINLVTNSIHAVEEVENATITINYRLDANKLAIDVSDNGKGVDQDMIEKIFVPFYTTRTNGSGIGLTITRNIMKMHQGNVEVNSIPFELTTFSLVFKYS